MSVAIEPACTPVSLITPQVATIWNEVLVQQAADGHNAAAMQRLVNFDLRHTTASSPSGRALDAAVVSSPQLPGVSAAAAIYSNSTGHVPGMLVSSAGVNRDKAIIPYASPPAPSGKRCTLKDQQNSWGRQHCGMPRELTCIVLARLCLLVLQCLQAHTTAAAAARTQQSAAQSSQAPAHPCSSCPALAAQDNSSSRSNLKPQRSARRRSWQPWRSRASPQTRP